jgi:DNA-binding protein H-NS
MGFKRAAQKGMVMVEATPGHEKSGRVSGEIDLAALTLRELSILIENAEAMRRQKQEEARERLLAEFREKASGMGLSLDSLFPLARGRKPGEAKVAVKYRGPNGEAWSGRGRLPRWLAEAERRGRNRDEFLI